MCAALARQFQKEFAEVEFKSFPVSYFKVVLRGAGARKILTMTYVLPPSLHLGDPISDPGDF